MGLQIMYSLYMTWLILSSTLNHVHSLDLMDLSAQSFTETIQSGKTILIYFHNQEGPAMQKFLEQLKSSAEALQDYGILVAKVNCSKENIPEYCTGEDVMKKAYLFRGAEMLRTFAVETIFDENAIVSHMLLTLLYNEVRYIHTAAELLQVQRAAKGKSDIVMGHIDTLGLPEHRALMEAAFVYGGTYQFVQTTGTPLLRHMGISGRPTVRARLWFLHCSTASGGSDPCPHTPMRNPLTTVNVHAFLQLMAAPLLTEVDEEPGRADVVYTRLNVPALFLFSRAETLGADRDTALHLAGRLRGEVGLVLVHRDGKVVKTPSTYNAAYRLPQQEVKYFSLKNVEEVVSLIRGEQIHEDEDDEEDEDERWVSLDVLDDEVAESVYRDRGVALDTEPDSGLTAQSFKAAVKQSGLTVVLFYVKWDAGSMAFLQSYAEVIEAFEGVNDVTLASVDCGEWTCVCRDQNVTSFPSVLLFRPGELPRPFRGMMGTDSLYRFLLLSRPPAPIPLSSSPEVLSFLEGDSYRELSTLSPIRVLGLFSADDPDVLVFQEASESLRGEAILGLFAHDEAETWVQDHSVSLPALLVSRGVRREAHSLLTSNVGETVSQIRRATLEPLPELTVENLPIYLELGKPLLLLFMGVGEEEEEGMLQVLEEMMRAQRSGGLSSSQPCWIHMGRTPAGRLVLESYLGFVPPLPALVLSQLSSSGEVYQFPSERSLLSENIVQWLRRVEAGEELAAGVVPEGAWPPPVPFYDFLAIMDEETPGSASQQSPKSKSGGKNMPQGEKKINDAELRETLKTETSFLHTEL